MLEHNGIRVKDKKCLILGSGGTSHTVAAVFKHLGASQVLIVSRQSSDTTISYDECYANHTDAQVIANTTPQGMYPNIDASPIDLTTFTQCEAVVDAIFNPLETRLILQARQLGMKGVTGLEMLVAQAKQAIEYFLDTKLEDRVIEDTYQYLLEVIRDK
jgi:shikimate dehydrogenase